jgi:hypothetical protein
MGLPALRGGALRFAVRAIGIPSGLFTQPFGPARAGQLLHIARPRTELSGSKSMRIPAKLKEAKSLSPTGHILWRLVETKPYPQTGQHPQTNPVPRLAGVAEGRGWTALSQTKNSP